MIGHLSEMLTFPKSSHSDINIKKMKLLALHCFLTLNLLWRITNKFCFKQTLIIFLLC